MKRITLLLMVLLICSSSFLGCDLLNVDDDYEETEKEQSKEDKQENKDPDDDEGPEISNETKLKEFTDLLISSEYVKAIEYYNENIVGNYDLENNANESILNICKDIDSKVLSGEYDQKQVDTKLGVIDKVIEGIEVVPNGYEDLVDKIEVSLASKSAFLAARELENLKNYADAINEYKKVVEADVDFNEAQSAIERCISTLKKNVFDKVELLSQTEEYIEAIELLKSLNENLPGDQEIISKITVYEKTYIRNTIDNAASAFIMPDKDYAKALEIINEALQHYSENEELIAKKEYYQSFAPVYLYDMKILKGEADTKSTDADIFGNTYNKCFWTGYGSYALWYETDVSYFMDKTYNSFTATVYSRSSKNDTQNMIVKIYLDDKIIYDKSNIADNATQPFTINLDITGVSVLRIVLTRNNGAIGAGIGMTDMIVQKTVK